MQDKAKNGSILIRDIGKGSILKRIQDIREGRVLPNDILTHILLVSNHLQDSYVFGMEEMIDKFVTFITAGLLHRYSCIGVHSSYSNNIANEINKKRSIIEKDVSANTYFAVL